MIVFHGVGADRKSPVFEPGPIGLYVEDDSATGTFTDKPGLTVPQGPASWLDTNLTNDEMASFLPNAGQGQKISARFKSKVFSFGHVAVADNKLTLFQISEPLQSTSSGTPANPAPFGTDISGHPLNDPIPDTIVDPATGVVVSPPATGTPALLDKWTVIKPELRSTVSVKLTASGKAFVGSKVTYTVQLNNESQTNLSGTQVRLHSIMYRSPCLRNSSGASSASTEG